MNNKTKLVLLGLLLLVLVAPFAAFAPLILVVFVASMTLMGWTLMQILVTGKAGESDRPTATDDP